MYEREREREYCAGLLFDYERDRVKSCLRERERERAREREYCAGLIFDQGLYWSFQTGRSFAKIL